MLKQLTFIIVSYLLIGNSQLSWTENYIIGVEDLEYYPIYAKREGEYAGFARELLDKFAEDSGHTFEYKILPVKRLYSDFIKLKYDLKFPDNAYWQEKVKEGNKIYYSDPVLEYIDGVLVKPSNINKGLDGLKNLGAPRGFSPWDYMTHIDNKSINLKEGNSLKSLIKMVESDRIDGVYFNIIVARYFLEHTEFKNDAVIFDKELPHTNSHYHLSTIKHPDVVSSFNNFMKNNKSEIEILKAKYNVTLN